MGRVTNKKGLKMANSRTKAKTKRQNNDLLKGGIIAGGIGVFFTLGAIGNIGTGYTFGVSIFAIIVGAIAAAFSVPVFLKEKKNPAKKTIVALALAGVTVLGSLVAMIADPIAVKVRCSSYNSVEEMKIGDSSRCRERVDELKRQKQEEETAKAEAIEAEKQECSAKSYDWNSDAGRCNTESEQKEAEKKKAEEAAIEKAKSECSAKKYDWNYDKKRCNTDSEQKAKEAEREAERKRQEEANRTTTITGKDHDSNDMAGKFDKIMNACWDELDAFWTAGVSILDSNDGYPISYSVTVKGDGTLVKGYMVGYYRTHGGKIKELNCVYENGSASVKGL